MYWTHVFYFLFILFNFYDTKLFKDSPLGGFGGPERTEIFGVVGGGSPSFTTDVSC